MQSAKQQSYLLLQFKIYLFATFYLLSTFTGKQKNQQIQLILRIKNQLELLKKNGY